MEMDENSFPHHSGGVVQVRHRERFGAVPEALLEDERLDLDSRAVAAWLAVKPAGWQISIANLRRRLAKKDKPMLGKDRWQRIAHELEFAGYLSRKKVNGKEGRWVWQIIFNPVPERITVGGFAGFGAAEHGASSSGLAGAGLPGHKVIPISELPIKDTTTTSEAVKFNDSMESRDDSDLVKLNIVQELHFPHATRIELDVLENLIWRCPASSRQDVLDEIEGIRRAGAIKLGIVPLAKALIKKVKADEFFLSAGLAEQYRREASFRLEKAIANADALAKCPPIKEEIMSSLPPNVARKTREAISKVRSADIQSREQEEAKRKFG